MDSVVDAPVADWLIVTLLAAGTAVATGLGALPFLVLKDLSARVLALASAAAGGAMLGASIGLINEGMKNNGAGGEWRTTIGAAAGFVLITLLQKLVPDSDDLTVGSLSAANAKRAILVLGVMTIHSAAEGVGVGVSFAGGEAFGLAITLAIAVHNIPEGIAISAVMVPKGTPVWKAAWWSVFSSIPQPLLALPAFLFVDAFAWWLPVGLGIAAGAMIWMVVAELLPEALEDAKRGPVALATGAGLAAMLALQVALVTH
jgi:zinc transporter ZupT